MPERKRVDEALRALCTVIDGFPGISATCSYQNAINGLQRANPWTVHFSFKGVMTNAALASIEFLVWLQNEARPAGFSDLMIGVNSPPPSLNGPCRPLYFFLRCSHGEPDGLAEFISDMRSKLFFLP